MAYIKSAKKRIKQTKVRTERNVARTSRIRTSIKKLEEIIATGNLENAQTAFKETMSELHRAAQIGVVKKGTVNRKISRLNARIKKLAS